MIFLRQIRRWWLRKVECSQRVVAGGRVMGNKPRKPSSKRKKKHTHTPLSHQAKELRLHSVDNGESSRSLKQKKKEM